MRNGYAVRRQVGWRIIGRTHSITDLFPLLSGLVRSALPLGAAGLNSFIFDGFITRAALSWTALLALQRKQMHQYSEWPKGYVTVAAWSNLTGAPRRGAQLELRLEGRTHENTLRDDLPAPLGERHRPDLVTHHQCSVGRARARYLGLHRPRLGWGSARVTGARPGAARAGA
jgi:hypothetical protein